MNSPMVKRFIPKVDEITDGVMLALWKQGLNTNEIAKKLHLHEFQVANDLPRLRELYQ